MFCEKCGCKLEEGAKFCQECGAPVSRRDITCESRPADETHVSMKTASSGAGTASAAAGSKPLQGKTFARPSGEIKALCVLLCVIGFCGLFATMMIFSMKGVLGKSGIKQIMRSSDAFVDYCSDMIGGMGFASDSREIEAFLEENEELRDVFAGQASNVLMFMLTGEGEPLDVDRIMDAIEKHEDEIEDFFDINIGRGDMEELREMIGHEAEQIIDDSFSMSEEFRNFGRFFTTGFIISQITVVAVCFGLMGFLFRINWDKTMVYAGVTTLVCGICVFLFGLLVNVFAGAASSQFTVLVTMLGGNLLKAGVVALVFGVLLIVCGKMYRSKIIRPLQTAA